jgi:hypothetical protein
MYRNVDAMRRWPMQRVTAMSCMNWTLPCCSLYKLCVCPISALEESLCSLFRHAFSCLHLNSNKLLLNSRRFDSQGTTITGGGRHGLGESLGTGTSTWEYSVWPLSVPLTSSTHALTTLFLLL